MSETLLAMVWERLAGFVTGRLSWLPALMIVLASGGLMAMSGAANSGSQSPNSVPTASDSAKAAVELSQFPGSDRASAILVTTRRDSLPLTPADLDAARQAWERTQRTDQLIPGATSPQITSTDGKAVLATVSVCSRLSGLLSDAVKALRAAAADGLPSQLNVHVTGGPAFGADIANAFSGADLTLLVVTMLVVALLLIATYRSPVLWLVPLIVIALADRVATVVGPVVAGAIGQTFDGATSGITSVLVFGAGTNYALLLISRYREELRNETSHRRALRAAVRAAGPAIVASNVTVVLALLTLMLAVTRAHAAWALSGRAAWSSRRCCAVRLTAALGHVRPKSVLAVHSTRRSPVDHDNRSLAPSCRRGPAQGRPGLRSRGHRPGCVDRRAVHNAYRAVAEPAVPHPSRFSGRLRYAGRAFPRRCIRPDGGDRLHRVANAGAAR